MFFAPMMNFLADHLDYVIIGAAVVFFFFQVEFAGRGSH
ncbi:MAG: hypothetical protein JWM77_2745 [Rhodospirillales bacterium]|nr:hypothetical protein [Rhodospirillales bacterium]